MWQALRDIVNNAKQSLGIELPAVPGGSAVTDVVTGAGAQAGDAVTTATDAASGAVTDAAADATGTAVDTVTGAAETAGAAGEQLTGKLSDLLGRFGG